MTDETPREDEIAVAELIAVSARAADTIKALRERQIQKAGLPAAQFRALLLLTSTDTNTMTQTELSEKLGVTKPNVTTLVDRMEANGYVRRSTSPTDKRIVLVTSTERTTDLVREILPRRLTLTNKLFDCLTPQEKRDLYRITVKLLNWLDADVTDSED